MPLSQASLIKKSNLTDNVIELTFEVEDKFNFEPGQFVTIKVDDKIPPCFRAYSIASSTTEENLFQLCVKVVVDGRGSNWLNSLKIGDSLNFIGPSGKFTYQNQEDKVLFIATGTGVAPFRSIIETELKNGNSKKIDLLFGVRHESDLFYQELFQNLNEKHSNFNWKMCLSRPETANWNGETGRVTNILENLDFEEYLTNSEIYICGLKAMIDDVITILKKRGVPEDKIHFEKYD